jgi:hypothetical protein
MQRKGMVESFLGRLVNGAGRVENGAPDAKKPRVVVGECLVGLPLTKSVSDMK